MIVLSLSDERVIVPGVTIKPQVARVDERWWPANVQRRVREVLPPGITVVVMDDWLRDRIEVCLSESWQRRLLRAVGVESMSRASVLARVACELADAPSGVAVTTLWV